MSTQPEPDCGSSSCIFSAKGGMRTNGPCRCYENAGFHGSAVMAARQMLPELLKLRAAHAWIETSERMPDAADGSCCDVLAIIDGTAIVLSCTPDDAVHPWADEFSNIYRADEVTHWQPMPEPPK